MKTIGNPSVCVLCGGDGSVSCETARYYGKHEGDSTCPSCNGSGRVPYRPLCAVSPCMGLAVCNVCRQCATHHKAKGCNRPV